MILLLLSKNPYFKRNETEILKILHHPGVIKYKETIETKTHIYIIEELFKGMELFEYVVLKKYISEQEAIKISVQILDTLIYIHATGN